VNDVVREAGESAGLLAEISAWEDPPRAALPDSTPVLAVDGFEGPLDWLLEMAQARKIDLARLSIASLIDAFATALEVALARQTGSRAAELGRWGGWLVMAATVAFLRSRLLLPGDSSEAKAATGRSRSAAASARQPGAGTRGCRLARAPAAARTRRVRPRRRATPRRRRPDRRHRRAAAGLPGCAACAAGAGGCPSPPATPTLAGRRRSPGALLCTQ
jgi:hypothetical protein